MRLLLIGIVAASMLSACSTMGSVRPPPADAPVDFLLTSSAQDFKAHPPKPTRFREVYLGHVTASNGEKQYLICGELLKAENGGIRWVPFATVKTSGYEQWVGAQTATVCPTMTRDSDEDFAAALKTKLASEG